MDSESDRAVALMAIHPDFVERILSGEKRVEFRKVQFRSEVTHIVIYCTEPVGSIIGFFEVESLDIASPDDLWDRYAEVSGIDRSGFQSYFDGRVLGVAIRIGRVHQLDNPLPISALGKSSRPPQSFRYLASEVLDELLPRSGLVLASA